MQGLGNLLLKSIALFCGHHISINYSANIMQFTLMTGVKRTKNIKFSPLLLQVWELKSGMVRVNKFRTISLFRISRTRHVCHTRTQTLKHGPYFKSSRRQLGELEGTYIFLLEEHLEEVGERGRKGNKHSPSNCTRHWLEETGDPDLYCTVYAPSYTLSSPPGFFEK